MDADIVTVTTVAATVVVAAAAIVSLIMSGRAGHHAKRSAEASEWASVAARDAAAASLAAVEVNFDVDYIFGASTGVIGITPKHMSVWVHSVRLIGVFDATGFKHRDDECRFVQPESPTIFVHTGNTLLCHWPGSLPRRSFYGLLEITYSFEQDGATETYRHIAKGKGP